MIQRLFRHPLGPSLRFAHYFILANGANGEFGKLLFFSLTESQEGQEKRLWDTWPGQLNQPTASQNKQKNNQSACRERRTRCPCLNLNAPLESLALAKSR